MSNCQRCSDLRQIALAASKAYHELLINLEAAHIRRDLEAQLFLSEGLERALQGREAAIAELTNHEATHADDEPAQGPR
jgi:hypothetical protein